MPPRRLNVLPKSSTSRHVDVLPVGCFPCIHECCASTVALQELSLGDIDKFATRDFTGLIVHRKFNQFTGQA